jgi:hypothetical protein
VTDYGRDSVSTQAAVCNENKSSYNTTPYKIWSKTEIIYKTQKL